MSDDVAALRAELAGLRRRVRLLGGLLLGGFAAVLLLLSRGRGPAGDVAAVGQIEAQEFRLLDPEGKLRGLLTAPPAGPSLTLMDEAGRAGVVLAADAGGVKLALGYGPARLVLAGDPRQPGLSLLDGRGRTRLAAAIDGDSAALTMLGTDGAVVARVRQGPGGGEVRITDLAGKVIWERP